MAEILSIPVEFDTIQVVQTGLESGSDVPHVEKHDVPRPPLGPFTYHAAQTFAKQCSEGRIGLNWRDNLVCARETWKRLSPAKLFSLRRAADEDKQRYNERVELVGRAGAEKLAHLLEETKLQESGFAPSAFDLFKNSPQVRARLFEAKQGPVDDYEYYKDKVFLWLWGRIVDEEKSHWKHEAQWLLDIRNNARRTKGEEELTLDTDPQPPEESPTPGKRMRLGPKTRPSDNDEVVLSTDDVDVSDDDEAEVDDDSDDDDDEVEDDGGDNEDNEAEVDDDDDNGDSEADGDDKQQSQIADAKVDPVNAYSLEWRPTGDENLTEDEKKLLESIPSDVSRWDRSPRQARNAYTLFYADRQTAEGSPNVGADPHCPSTRAKIHAAWEAADHETRQRFEDLAKIDQQEFDRQEKEWYNEWQKAWCGLEHRLLLRKVIHRWHPHSSFDDGQNRLRADIPPRGRQPAVPAVEYRLPCLNYPVIRTDYSNGPVYEHLRHVLLNSSLYGEPLNMELTFYDGLQPPLPSTPVEDWEEMPGLAEDDPRANDYQWCKTNFENKSLDDLKTSFGELSFHRKEHIPVYTFGGKFYAIVIDSQSMKDGTVVFVSMNSSDIVDNRPDGDRGLDGAWEQDTKKEWYLAPRVQAADVTIQLVNLDICNMDWHEFVQHGVDHGLDLLSDPKAQQWRGWQWAIEYVFGEQALENVVGVIETIPSDACVPYEDDE